jgi:hypothetical protein
LCLHISASSIKELREMKVERLTGAFTAAAGLWRQGDDM